MYTLLSIPSSFTPHTNYHHYAHDRLGQEIEMDDRKRKMEDGRWKVEGRKREAVKGSGKWKVA